jgi:hypothetical protein
MCIEMMGRIERKVLQKQSNILLDSSTLSIIERHQNNRAQLKFSYELSFKTSHTLRKYGNMAILEFKSTHAKTRFACFTYDTRNNCFKSEVKK